MIQTTIRSPSKSWTNWMETYEIMILRAYSIVFYYEMVSFVSMAEKTEITCALQTNYEAKGSFEIT